MGDRAEIRAVVRRQRRGAAGIGDAPHAFRLGRLEDVQRADQIDPGAENRVGGAVRGQQSGEMDREIAAPRCVADPVGVGNVAGHPVDTIGRAADDFAQDGTVFLAVEHPGFNALGNQPFDEPGAEKTAATRDQNLHCAAPVPAISAAVS